MEGVRRILGVGSTRWLSETFLSLSLSPSFLSLPCLHFSPRSISLSVASSFSTSRILLISWLKMSDTRTIDRSCASPQDYNGPVPAREEQVCEKKKEEKRRKSGGRWTMRKMQTDIEFS